MDEINTFLKGTIGQVFVGVDDSSIPSGWYGGSKYLESPLFIAAFNYFPEENFLSFIRGLDWKYPEEVQLIIQRDRDDKFSIKGIGSE